MTVLTKPSAKPSAYLPDEYAHPLISRIGCRKISGTAHHNLRHFRSFREYDGQYIGLMNHAERNERFAEGSSELIQENMECMESHLVNMKLPSMFAAVRHNYNGEEVGINDILGLGGEVAMTSDAYITDRVVIASWNAIQKIKAESEQTKGGTGDLIDTEFGRLQLISHPYLKSGKVFLLDPKMWELHCTFNDVSPAREGFGKLRDLPSSQPVSYSWRIYLENYFTFKCHDESSVGVLLPAGVEK